MDHQYDLVVVGSGLGGLACGVLFAKEGYKVCVLERNKQIGGNLQTFARDKVIFDSGVHYVGGLGEGQNLFQIFKYLGIMEKLKIHKMDEDIVDGIVFGGSSKIYRHAQGYERFIKNIAADFPEEEENIRAYCDEIKKICQKFPLYNLRSGDAFEKNDVLGIDTHTFLESITSNEKLQNILAGSNLLYAGESHKTPLYVHALIINSYIEGSYRFVDGGSQIARLLTKQIRNYKGEVKTGQQVVRLNERDGKIEFAECTNGQRYFGKVFISNAHPANTLELVESDLIKKIYRTRIKGLQNSISVFSINIVMKKNSFKYLNHNIYYFEKEDVWGLIDYKPEEWPSGFALFFSASSKQNGFADGITLMTYMRYEETLAWKDTFNTALDEKSRGEQYEQFKKEKSEKLIDCADKIFPGLKDNIYSY
ncbi:MAG TPA: NAD(P)/FAD-dependent oxidoreductase, partial [Cyclobacteriaceae bacterium]|nr:NAD(P)/FAD-dependent oxidoreductase [Cyclobacteriaceae bacterium]